ncbi:hypothetical protein ACHAPT_002779 [Fusarium lateritium]
MTTSFPPGSLCQIPAGQSRAGLCLPIHRHVPPRPFGRYYVKGNERQPAGEELLKGIPQSHWCLQQPPTETSPHADLATATLHIIDGIACEDGRGAQIIKCYLDQDEEQIYVAKIYDPLYYAYRDRDRGTPVDVTWMADKDYSREAAAYEELKRSRVDGLFAPKYHGSWTFDMALPTEPETARSVRLILMEWIEGVSMWSLMEPEKKKRRIPPQQRLDMLAEAMEVEAKVNFYGVKHGDFAPRNIMLVGSDLEKRPPKVKLVDFNKSVVYDEPNCRYTRSSTHLPIHPQHRHWGSCNPEFVNCVPEPQRSRPLAFKGWLKQRWDGSEEFAKRDEGKIKNLDYDEPVEMVPPQEDREPPSALEIVAAAIQLKARGACQDAT